jgi:hypothetical protein
MIDYKLNFCTLFNSGYLTRGLAMYESLLQHCSDFHLYIYAFDDVCYDYFKSQSFKNLTVISLTEFENEELLRIKPTRTVGEYCWTCSSSSIYHAITTFDLNHCTYIDADMIFYTNPKVLIEEMGEKSVLITNHRYSPKHDQTKLSGKYCVQFVTFKNNTSGLEVLNWWKNACIDWCYNRIENGKFGDQKYLDDWLIRFDCVHELRHLGGGVAPWNVDQYTFETQPSGILLGTEIATGKQFELVFYHFHGLKFYENQIIGLTEFRYEIDKKIQKLMYFPYVKQLHHWSVLLKKTMSNLNPNGNGGLTIYKPNMNLFTILRLYLFEISISKYNIFGFTLFKRIKNYHYFYRDKILQDNSIE